ncbi:DUF1259 domain-containing protein [Pseudonocardia nigra]|uniref:DUF1259 domain-containing protein n=1 Tax=Pseudonocardia nigra TaxID=1921578 RepID=UPI001FECBD19|nr:DUF1259 domain-containing protein [Pseudonocardia nigra]
MTSAGRRRALLAVAGAAVLVLAGCSSGGEAGAAGENVTATRDAAIHETEQGAAQDAVAPVPTSEGDWQGVAEALGRQGTLSNETVYRVSFPRADLSVTSQGVQIAPGFALGSYAAFARYPDTTMVMGDLVVTEQELQQVTTALQDNGIGQTAVHKHLLAHEPPIWWTHFEAAGPDPVALARGIRAALDQTATPPAGSGSPSTGQLDLDTAAIDAALGTAGSAEGGIYKFSFARAETVSMHGRVLPPAMGVTTAINFQPTGGGNAAINGDFVMTADEVQGVIQALREGGIEIVELHNHTLAEQPRLFYMHFWANDDGAALAQTLARAVDAHNVRPVG